MVDFRSVAVAEGDGTGVTVTAPAGVVVDDLLVAFVSGNNTNRTGHVAPAGWEFVGTWQVSTSNGLSVFYRKATGSEPGSYTFTTTAGGSATVRAVVAAYTGGWRFHFAQVATAHNSTTGVTISGFTPPAGDLAVYAAATFHNLFMENLTGSPATTARFSGPARGLWDAPNTISQPSRQASQFSGSDSSSWVLVGGWIVSNTTPNAPGFLSPDGPTINKDVTQRFSWVFSDPDAGDSQSKYDLRYRLVGAGSWTDVTGTTTNQFRDFSGGTFTAGDWEWQVRTYDAQGVVGPWSASAFFTAAASPTGHTITAPTGGSTISASPYLVTWSTPAQDAYQLRVVADDAGSPDTGTVYTDTGTVTSTSARSRSVDFDTNGIAVHVQLRVQVAGLWSDWASVAASVSYTVPGTPTAVVTPHPGTASIIVAVVNPTPVGDEPNVTGNEVWVRVAAGGRRDVDRTVADAGIRIGLVGGNGTFVDRAPASGAEYEYRVRAIGDNETGAWSDWTS